MIFFRKYYLTSLIGSLFLSLTGLIFSSLIDFEPGLWAFPLNILVLILIVVQAVILSVYYRKTTIYQILVHAQTTLGVLTGILILLLIPGFIPQLNVYALKNEMSVFDVFTKTLTSSFSFALNILCLVFILVLVLLKKKPKINLRYISFQCNHAGLLLASSAGFFGASDKTEYKVLIEPQVLTQTGFSLKGQPQRLPFSLMLNDFSVEKYPGRLILLENINKTVVETGSVELEKGITDYVLQDMHLYVQTDSQNNLMIRINDSVDYSINNEGQSFCNISESEVLFRKDGKPRQYSALVSMEYEKRTYQDWLLVNHPVIRDNYYIYLESYEYLQGESLPRVLIRIVKDPWISIAYAGLWMMMAGAVMLIMTGPVGVREIEHYNKEEK
ncbi:MAG: hypothetical protein ACRCX4_07520 [Bacteroidales bacterium]